jgi:hypothetical protein
MFYTTGKGLHLNTIEKYYICEETTTTKFTTKTPYNIMPSSKPYSN